MKTNHQHTLVCEKLSTLQIEIVEKLAYFAVFKHPNTASELQNSTHHYYAIQHINEALEVLCESRLCFQHKNYYSALPSIKSDLKRRKQGEQNAKLFFKKLPFYARLISHFPYVRGVAVSGSLSKGVIHKGGDIDYFIITTDKRLWLARVLLVAFKKLFLFNSHRYFCVNYFISEKHLEIPDRNIFTATEVSTLLPVYGLKEFAKFKKANNWIGQYYGHFKIKNRIVDFSPGKKPVKRCIEFLLNNPIGNLLDILFMYITVWRWGVKFKHFSRSKYDLTLRSTRNVSKHHPQDFQTVVLNKFQKQKTKMLKRINL